MINLIPLPDKQAQHKERRLRAITVFLALFLLVETVSVIILSAPYFLASAKMHITDVELAQIEEKVATSGGENYTDVVKTTNQKLDYFFSEDARPLADSALLERVMAKIPTGVSVTSFSITAAAAPADKKKDMPKNARFFRVAGTASTRSTLLAFVDALKTTEGVSDVVLPVSNFTDSTDIDFSVTFTAF